MVYIKPAPSKDSNFRACSPWGANFRAVKISLLLQPALRQQLITPRRSPFKEIKPIYHGHKPHSDSAFCNRAIYCFDTEKQFNLLQITWNSSKLSCSDRQLGWFYFIFFPCLRKTISFFEAFRQPISLETLNRTYRITEALSRYKTSCALSGIVSVSS